jgi:hypothetical protein
MMFRKALTMTFGLTLVIILIMYVNMAKAQIVTEGLVSYWTFDEADIDGDTVKDLIGTNNGTIVNQVEIVKGKVNQAFLFSGGYVEVPDDPSIKPNQFSIQFWVNSNQEFGATSRFDLVDNTGQIIIRNDERAEFGANLAFHWSDGAVWQAINPAFILSAEEWYNVAVTQDGSAAKIYVDGKLEDSLSKGFAWSAGETGISIGAHKWAAANFFDGMIDEILFYDKALTEGEVKKNYGAVGLSIVDSGNKLPICWGEIKVSR